MNDSRNESTSSLPQFSVQIIYTILGSSSIVANSLILFIVSKKKSLLKSSAFVVGLAGADLVVGLASVIAAVYRLIILKETKENFSVHPLFCMKRISTLMVIASQITPAMLILIGSERLLAVICFRWYYKMWTHQKAWFSFYFVCIPFLFYLSYYMLDNCINISN